MNKKIGIVFVALIIIAIWLYWGNTSIQSTYINIHSEKIPANFNGFTIVQVSDLHNASFGNRQADLLDDIKSASPDIIAVTGDLIDSNRTDLAKAMEFINGAVKIAPVYYVTGNHEARSYHYGELRRQMIEAGVTILDDESIPIKRDTDVIHLLGVNDPNVADPDNMTGNARQMDEKLKTIVSNDKDYMVLLSHRPELFGAYLKNDIDLILSGHAHGGQVRLPFIGGLVAPDQGLFPKYSQGLYERKNTKMVVSRGLGNSIIPLRVNNRPELVIITLKIYQ